jgi:hypothetical protein
MHPTLLVARLKYFQKALVLVLVLVQALALVLQNLVPALLMMALVLQMMVLALLMKQVLMMALQNLVQHFGQLLYLQLVLLLKGPQKARLIQQVHPQLVAVLNWQLPM